MEEERKSPAPASGKSLVMAVDDSKTILKIYEHSFQTIRELQHFSLVTCGSATEALAWLQANAPTAPSIILLDWVMEGMSGMELLDRLKLDARWKDIPVIMATSKGGQESVVLAAAKGVKDFIVKPIQNKVLVRKLLKVVGSPLAPLPPPSGPASIDGSAPASTDESEEGSAKQEVAAPAETDNAPHAEAPVHAGAPEASKAPTV